MLGQKEEAIATYNEILADEFENLQAIRSPSTGSTLRAARGPSWPRTSSASRPLSSDPDKQIELNLRLGDLRLTKLEQAGQAVETYHRVLALDAGNATALGALETLLTNEQQQLTVAKTLEPFYRVNNNWPRLIQAYEIMVTHASDAEEKIGLLHRIAELYEIAGEEQGKAFDALGRAFKVDPSNATTQERLETLARQLEDYPRLVALYDESIPDIVDDALIIRLLVKIAQISRARDRGPRPRPRRATSGSWASTLATSRPSTRSSTSTSRTRTSARLRRGAVVRKSEMVTEVADRKALLLYAAQTRETAMEDPAGAITLYQQVLALDDADASALDALAKLFTQTEAWENLKDIYRRKTELAESPEHRRYWLAPARPDLRREAQGRRAGDRDLPRHPRPRCRPTTTPSRRSTASTVRPSAGRTSSSGSSSGPSRSRRSATKTALRHRIGGLYETQLADIVRAVEAYRDTLAHAFDHAPTIAALDRIVHGEDQPMLAAEVLAPFYNQLAEWEKLVDIYEVMVRQVQDPAQRDRAAAPRSPRSTSGSCSSSSRRSPPTPARW